MSYASIIKMKGVLHNGMSLFQDLKLKRRKVDSRCSSDGESIGTSDSTASLSPEAQSQAEGSPKDKDRCITPEELGPPVINGSSSAYLFMMKGDRGVIGENVNGSSLKTNGVIKLTTNGTTHGVNGNFVIHVKSEPKEHDGKGSGEEENGLSLIVSKVAKRSRESSPEKNGQVGRKSPGEQRNSMSSSSNPSSTAGSDCESTTSRGSIKREKIRRSEDEIIRNSPPPLVSRPRSTVSPPGQTNSNNSAASPSSGTSGIASSPQSSMSSIPSPSSITIVGKHPQRLSPNSNRVPSPPQHPQIHLMTHPHARTDPPFSGHHTSNLLHSRLTIPLDSRPNGNSNNNGAHIRVPSPLVQAELRSLAEKPDPLSVVTSTSLSFPHHSMYRINGVRPEVISGGAVTPTSNAGSNSSTASTLSPPGHHQHMMRKSPNSVISRSPNASPQSNASSSGSSSMHTNGSIHSPGSGSGTTIVAGGSLGMNSASGNNNSNSHHHVNLNRTPTVIMGEAGGVRTMLWSQPGQNGSCEVGNHNNSPAPLPSSTSNGHYGHGPPNGHHAHPMTNGHMNNSSPPSPMHIQNNNGHLNGHLNHVKGGLSMERLWASEALNLSTGQNTGNSLVNSHGHPPGTTNLNPVSHQNGHQHHITASNGPSHPDDDEYEQPMICMICEDRATGLHYGIITCEGCKGFFKRTVQNRRVYTCVADGTCEITKAQRNRCQYCRFKKCIEQGMVLQAVREDRMPGGRNSGAVYNLYKVPVKYRKHKKGNRANNGGGNGKNNDKMSNNNSNNNNNNHIITNGHHHINGNNGMNNPGNHCPPHNPPMPNGISGTILKAALTSPNEVNQMRQAAGMPFDQAAAMITNLVQCDNFHDIAALQNWEELLEGRGDLSEKLCQMGDSIVYRLVQWTKRLPFYTEVPVEVHTRVLTHKWHELLVLTTSAWQAMHTPGPTNSSLTAEEETMENLQVLQRCLQAMMGRSLTLDQLRQDVGQMVERLTYLTRSFRRLGIRLEEYVSLKVIAMLQNTGVKSNEVTIIQERYIKCLRTFLEVTCPNHPNRLNDLLRTLPEVQTAAALLLESKMFYVPFLLNSALLQR